MIFRNDDVNKYTDLTILSKIQKLFVKYNHVHTVTLLMKDLWESRGVWEWLISTPNLDIALHGWEHIDYGVTGYATNKEHIELCLGYWNSHLSRIGKDIPLKVFYPPWNSVSESLIFVCREKGITVNNCVDEKQVYNFHWWEFINEDKFKELEQVLKGG